MQAKENAKPAEISSVDNDLQTAEKLELVGGDREAYELIYGAPGEFPAMQ